MVKQKYKLKRVGMVRNGCNCNFISTDKPILTVLFWRF